MQNVGVSLGLLPGIPWWVIVLVWLVVVGVAWKEKFSWARSGLVLIIIGGGMNGWERIQTGVVLDNLNLFGLLYNNLADYLIVSGLLVYGCSYIVRRR